MTNYEKYFGSPDKAAESCFGNLKKEMQNSCIKWMDDNPLIASFNSRVNVFKFWLETDVE